MGVDNYRIWASAMELALEIKHNMGFINGTCERATYAASAPLLEQWGRCNVVVLNWILSSLSQYVYLGHVFSNNAAKVWDELKDTYDRRLDSLSDHPILKDSLLALTLLPFEYPFRLLHASSPTDCLTPAFISVTDSPILSLPVELVLIPLSRPTFILRLSPARAEREEQGVLSNYFIPLTSLATSVFPTSASVVFGRACFVAKHLAMLAACNRRQAMTAGCDLTFRPATAVLSSSD
ncbi:ribonuclease H-like domain-containing protein [Tanacetum coccineum]